MATRTLHVRTPAGVKKFGLPIGSVIHARPGQTIADAAKAMKADLPRQNDKALALAHSPITGDRITVIGHTNPKKPPKITAYEYDGKNWVTQSGTSAGAVHTPEEVQGAVQAWVDSDEPSKGPGTVFATPVHTGMTGAELDKDISDLLPDPAPYVPPDGKMAEGVYTASPIGMTFTVPGKGVYQKTDADGWVGDNGDGLSNFGMSLNTGHFTGKKPIPDLPKSQKLLPAPEHHWEDDLLEQPVAPPGGNMLKPGEAQSQLDAVPIGSSIRFNNTPSTKYYTKTGPTSWVSSDNVEYYSPDFWGAVNAGHVSTYTPPPEKAPPPPAPNYVDTTKTYSSTYGKTQWTWNGEAWSPDSGSNTVDVDTMQGWLDTGGVVQNDAAHTFADKNLGYLATSPTNSTYYAYSNGQWHGYTASGIGLDVSDDTINDAVAKGNLVVGPAPTGPGYKIPAKIGYFNVAWFGKAPIGTVYAPDLGTVLEKTADNKWVPAGQPDSSTTDYGMKSLKGSFDNYPEAIPALEPSLSVKAGAAVPAFGGHVGAHKPVHSAMDDSPNITGHARTLREDPSCTSDPDFPMMTHAQAKANVSRKPTDDQQWQVDRYTGSWASDINPQLRQGEVEDDEEEIVNMDGAMGKLKKPMTLFRAAPTTSVGVPNEGGTSQEVFDALNALVGKDITDPGYLSTSYDVEGSPVAGTPFFTLRIRAPKGTPAVFSQTGSDFQEEHEMTLSRGLPLRVNSVDWQRSPSGNNMFILDVTPQPDKIAPGIVANFSTAKKGKVVPAKKSFNTTKLQLSQADPGATLTSATDGYVYTKQKDGTWTDDHGTGPYSYLGLIHEKFTSSLPLPPAEKAHTKEHKKVSGKVTQGQLKDAPEGSVFHGVSDWVKNKNGDWVNTDNALIVSSTQLAYGAGPAAWVQGALELAKSKPTPHKAKPKLVGPARKFTTDELAALPGGSVVQTADGSGTYTKWPNDNAWTSQAGNAIGGNILSGYNLHLSTDPLPLAPDPGDVAVLQTKIGGLLHMVPGSIITVNGATYTKTGDGKWRVAGGDEGLTSVGLAKLMLKEGKTP